MCHVLIIEDEPLIAMQIEDILLDRGATSVTIVVTEQEAVTEARGRRPDFITSDVRLIEGTGPRAVEAILTIYGTIPVLFITGTPEECQPCRSEAVMAKPVNFTEVGQRFVALWKAPAS